MHTCTGVGILMCFSNRYYCIFWGLKTTYQNSYCWSDLEVLTRSVVLTQPPCSGALTTSAQGCTGEKCCLQKSLDSPFPQPSPCPWPDISSREGTFQFFCHLYLVAQACGCLSYCRQEILSPEINLTANDTYLQRDSAAILPESMSMGQCLHRSILARTWKPVIL